MAISLSNAISGKREPKRGNRWILKFENVPTNNIGHGPVRSNGGESEAESLAIDLVSASRPTLSVNADASISRLNEKWKFASSPTWENIAVEYYDFDSGQTSATQILWRWMQSIYDVLNGTMGYAAHYKTDASLVLLGPGQSVNAAGTNSTRIEIIEAWDLFGCFPSQLTTGALSYESSDVLKVSIDMQFDYANLHTQSDFGGAGGTWNES